MSNKGKSTKGKQNQSEETMLEDTTQETTETEAQDQIEEVVIPEAANSMAASQDNYDEMPEDDDFGNRIDYQPKNAGIYREPMQGGNSWGNRRNHRGRGRNNNRHHRHQQAQQPEQEGVLSIRQPGWKDRMESSQKEDGVLTIRQQGNLARSLRYNQGKEHTYISKPGRRDNSEGGRRSNSNRGRNNNNQRRRSNSRRNQGK